MPKSKSKSSARVARSGGLPKHPGMSGGNALLGCRMGSEMATRLPDDFMDPTAATVLKSEYTVTSDAAGEACFGVSPTLIYHKISYPVTAGVLATSATVTAHPQNTSFGVEARLARRVHRCIRVTYIGTEMEAAGYISVLQRSLVADFDGGKTTDSLHTGALMQARACDGMMLHQSNMQEPRWETPTSTSFQGGTFAAALFVASGLPLSKPVFRVRVLDYMEFLPAEGTMSEGDTEVEPHDPGALSVYNQLAAPGTTVTSLKNEPSFGARIREAANAAYHIAQPYLDKYVVPQAKAYLKGALIQKGAQMLLTMG